MPSIEGGGVEKNLILVSNYLSTKIKNVILITISKRFKQKFNKTIKIKTLKSDIWDKQSRRFKYFLAILLLIKELIKKEKKLVFAFQANIYCIILCKIFGVKIIVRSNSAPVGWSQNLIKKKIFKFFLKKADLVMVNSLDFQNDLQKEFNVDAKCIYNPLNKKEILIKSKRKSRKFFKTKKLKILNVGRFTEQKDQLTLLKSLKLIKNTIKFEAIIVGRGILKNQLLNYINKNNLNDCIKLVDFLENPFPIIKQSELFILTSRYEGLPNVLLESLALNKFIISSNCRTGPKEILSNGKGGILFKVGDYKSLAKNIIFYNKNRNSCKKKLNFAKKNLDRFDYKENLNKYLEMVKEYM
tara:strand:- start:822 stop:1889 length:1068 start_codon:yes stop_codon:yes gene_type:complete